MKVGGIAAKGLASLAGAHVIDEFEANPITVLKMVCPPVV
jgi:hypothetical protein